MSMTLADIIRISDTLAPPLLAMQDDPIGLHAGDPSAAVEKAAVCLDVTARTLAAAHRAGAQAVLCHHPFIYSPMRSVAETDPLSLLLAEVVRSRMAVFSLHTNWDVASGGLNDHLAGLLGIRDAAPLQVTRRGSVQTGGVSAGSGLERVRWPWASGAGKIGDSRTAVSGPGTGGSARWRAHHRTSARLGSWRRWRNGSWKSGAGGGRGESARGDAGGTRMRRSRTTSRASTPGTHARRGACGQSGRDDTLCSFQQSV